MIVIVCSMPNDSMMTRHKMVFFLFAEKYCLNQPAYFALIFCIFSYRLFFFSIWKVSEINRKNVNFDMIRNDEIKNDVLYFYGNKFERIRNLLRVKPWRFSNEYICDKNIFMTVHKFLFWLAYAWIDANVKKSRTFFTWKKATVCCSCHLCWFAFVCVQFFFLFKFTRKPLTTFKIIQVFIIKVVLMLLSAERMLQEDWPRSVLQQVKSNTMIWAI